MPMPGRLGFPAAAAAAAAGGHWEWTVVSEGEGCGDKVRNVPYTVHIAGCSKTALTYETGTVRRLDSSHSYPKK